MTHPLVPERDQGLYLYGRELVKVKTLRSLSISDIHLGHPKTSTEHILTNLRRELPDQAWMDEVDILYIVGDLFDRLLDFNSGSAFAIKRWIKSLLKMCKRRDIVLRVLEGTPAHDRQQNRWFVEANADIGADLKYIDTLCIEHIDRFGIDVLYIPDEWKHETDAIWQDVTLALSQAGLEQVDFTLIHGTMDYQVPAAFGIPTHVTQRYLDITRHYIFTGHIHQSSVYERSLCNGSFDRLCHGDEGRKGYWDVTITPNGDQIVFRENHNAKIYRSIDVRELGDDYHTALEALRELPEDSHIRLEVNADSPALAALDVIRKQYPLFHWTVKSHDRADVQKNLFRDTRGQFQQTDFTRDNLPQILMDRIRSKYTDADLIAQCEAILLENL